MKITKSVTENIATEIYPILTEPGLFVGCSQSNDPTFSWVVSFTDACGKRFRRDVDLADNLSFDGAVTIARIYRKEVYMANSLKVDSSSWSRREYAEPTWESFMAVAYLSEPYRMGKGKRREENLYRHYVAPWFGDALLGETSLSRIREFQQHLVAMKGIDDCTVTEILSLMNKTLVDAERMSLIPCNPMAEMVRPKDIQESQRYADAKKALGRFFRRYVVLYGAFFSDFVEFYDMYVETSYLLGHSPLEESVVKFLLQHDDELRERYNCSWYPTLDKMHGFNGLCRARATNAKKRP